MSRIFIKKIIICIDRDGTLIYDTKEHLFLGRNEDWRSQVKLLPYVIEGLKVLNTIPLSAIYMITNQPGVAISDYPSLTFERAHEVCQHVMETLEVMGTHIDRYFLCPHATPEYMKEKAGLNFDKRYIHPNCQCFKPELGMVFGALKEENITSEGANVYIFGDRASDIQTALNIKGTGIFIPFENQQGEDEKVKSLDDQAHVHIARNLLDAAEFILEQKKDLQSFT